MLTLEEIQKLPTINLLVAREAFNQASQLLSDVLDTRKNYEQKAFTLLSGYVTVSFALFGAGGALFKENNLKHLALPLLFAGVMFVIGSMFFGFALMDSRYGALGSAPDMWLNKETLSGDDPTLSFMLAYITFYYQERIDVSLKANEKKALLIRLGIILGILAPIFFILLGALSLAMCS